MLNSILHTPKFEGSSFKTIVLSCIRDEDDMDFIEFLDHPKFITEVAVNMHGKRVSFKFDGGINANGVISGLHRSFKKSLKK